MTAKWKRKVKIHLALEFRERERMIVCINEHINVLRHALDRYSSIPEEERPLFVQRNISYFKNAIGGLKWLRSSINSKNLPEEPQKAG